MEHPKTLVFATSYMHDAQAWASRYQRWYRYYKQSPLRHLPLVLIDDGSPFLPDEEMVNVQPAHSPADIKTGYLNIIHFPNNLGRASLANYPGWWRSFLQSAALARQTGFNRIIHIESDAYILSSGLYDRLLSTQHGWTTFWLPTYQLPETAIQVIGEDQFDSMLQVWKHPDLNVELAEDILPFTCVDKSMKGDRYSEFKRNRWIFRSKKFDRFPLFQTDLFFAPIPEDADFATQVVARQFRDPRLNPASNT
mgnify:CR=1 FL=1